MEVDFLVIGSGLAGLTYVIKVAEKFPDKKVLVVAKGGQEDSNTHFAQGGVAIVQLESDSFEKHVQDTLTAGDGLCDEKIVRMVIREGPSCLSDLVNWGVDFDKDSKGQYDLGKEGGHSQNRVVHHKDITGEEISRALIERLDQLNNVKYLTEHFAIDLITEHHFEPRTISDSVTCYGAYILNEINDQIITVRSGITVLATGGIGQIYKQTTNPLIATGDGIAMAYRAKANIKDLEFVQFHPTALYDPKESPSFLISEAVRGAGAILRTIDGRAFMQDYDPRADLAPRDIVARAIDTELKNRGDNYVLLDCTFIDNDTFSTHFPNIKSRCLESGIDVHESPIPVSPAAHYVCGGISVDEYGQTSIRNLFACGECSRTGLHGGNRLASNSLLEAFVFGERAASQSSKLIEKVDLKITAPNWKSTGTVTSKEQILISHNRNELREIMQNYVGIVRSNERLERALKRLKLIYLETEGLYKKEKISVELCELRNMIAVAYLVVTLSQKRLENCGGYYNIDLK
ncbi:MAG: L-aspartate oxidase [Crocinitomicaceae bacterium]|nr:L-aspartate oxidase [Crocinitomicaceae bacterium]